MRTAMMAGRIGSAELTDLVAREDTLQFSLPVSSLARLSALAPRAGMAAEVATANLTASLSFQPGAEGHPRLHLVVAGTVPLVCQRCLELLAWPVSVDVVLTMIDDDRTAEELTDPFDTALLADGDLLADQVVEDEVLAALPIAPRHDATSRCGMTAGGEGEMNSGETHRPMAGLADLLGRGDRQDDQ